MPAVDRYWWLRALSALILLAGAGTFMVWSIDDILPLDRASGKPQGPDALMASTICFFLVTLAFYSSLGAYAARLRAKLRRMALHGDRDAVPLSRLAEELASYPRTATLPLDVREPNPWKFIIARAVILVAALGLAVYCAALGAQALFQLVQADVTRLTAPHG